MTDQIETVRLTLRPPVMADAAALAQHANDHEVTRWLTQLPYPYTEDDAKAFIARQTGTDTFAICLDGSPVGCVGTSGEFGYWLGRAHWGQGIATEAAHAVLDRHFAAHGRNLTSGHAIGNARSRRVLLKLGFRDCGVTDRTHAITGAARQQQIMALTASQWRAVA
ncbi:MAG: GNAT family N-acetyltransferase [Pseudomonadota bacterium]